MMYAVMTESTGTTTGELVKDRMLCVEHAEVKATGTMVI